MPSRSSKRPRDLNELAKLIIDLATGEAQEEQPPIERQKNPAAVALGRLGGKKGGIARAQKLAAEDRRRIAANAARARWTRNSGSKQ